MSELRADTITASDGSSPVTLTKQSAAKAWVSFNMTAVTVFGSLNNSSIVDNSTGDFTSNFSSSLANDDYSSTSYTAQRSDAINTSARVAGNSIKAASSHRQTCGYIAAVGGSLTYIDNDVNDFAFHGDLA